MKACQGFFVCEKYFVGKLDYVTGIFCCSWIASITGTCRDFSTVGKITSDSKSK